MSGATGETPPAGGFGGGPRGDQGAPMGYAPQPPASGSRVALVIVLVVVAVLVAIVAMLAVLGIYGVKRRTSLAKQAEARHALGQIGKGAIHAFEAEEYAAETPHVPHFMCDSASQPVPRDLASVRGKRYASSRAEWDVDGHHRPRPAGFACLKFSMEAPQWYQYAYSREGDAFAATAHGDVNGDGVPSTFVLRGQRNESRERLLVAPSIEETSPEE